MEICIHLPFAGNSNVFHQNLTCTTKFPNKDSKHVWPRLQMNWTLLRQGHLSCTSWRHSVALRLHLGYTRLHLGCKKDPVFQKESSGLQLPFTRVSHGLQSTPRLSNVEITRVAVDWGCAKWLHSVSLRLHLDCTRVTPGLQTMAQNLALSTMEIRTHTCHSADFQMSFIRYAQTKENHSPRGGATPCRWFQSDFMEKIPQHNQTQHSQRILLRIILTLVSLWMDSGSDPLQSQTLV